MAIKEQDKVFYEELANGDKVINLPITRVNNVEGLGRLKNTEYQVGNVVYVDSNLSVALKCINAGTTSNTELDISGKNIGNTVTDGSVVWKVCNRTSDVTSVNGKTGDVVVDLPVGHTYWSVEPNVPAGRLPALGATYNRALYADLWAWANNVGLVKSESEWQAIASANDGNCAYYSSGDGSSTFRVPSIKCWVKGANNVDEVGSYLEAGLPNINGSMRLIGSSSSGFYDGKSEGALSSENANGISRQFNYQNNAGSDIKDTIKFNAYDSNSIYGNSDTVQPPSIVGQWLIVAFGIAHNIGEADVANVMQAVEQVQTGLGVVDGISDYIIESYRNGTEWYEVYKSGKVRQGGYASIPAEVINNALSPITFLKAFADTNYTFVCTGQNDATSNGDWYIAWSNKTATQIGILTRFYHCMWYACGQGA